MIMIFYDHILRLNRILAIGDGDGGERGREIEREREGEKERESKKERDSVCKKESKRET